MPFSQTASRQAFRPHLHQVARLIGLIGLMALLGLSGGCTDDQADVANALLTDDLASAVYDISGSYTYKLTNAADAGEAAEFGSLFISQSGDTCTVNASGPRAAEVFNVPNSDAKRTLTATASIYTYEFDDVLVVNDGGNPRSALLQAYLRIAAYQGGLGMELSGSYIATLTFLDDNSTRTSDYRFRTIN